MTRILLRDRPIVITGASSGIGEAAAIACSRAGMPVVLGARRIEKVEAVANRIRSSGGRAIAIRSDVTSPVDCEKIVVVCVREFGSIYGAFANAGYGLEAPILDMPDDAVRAMFETNFYGTLHLIRAASRPMIRQRAGHILICSSCLARMSIPCFSIYCSTKAAQAHVGRALSLELEPHGIHVSTIHPIGTKTEFFDTARRLTGDDLLHFSADSMMQSADFVANAIVKCLRKPKTEVWTGLAGRGVRLSMALCTAFPGIDRPFLRRIVRKKLARSATK